MKYNVKLLLVLCVTSLLIYSCSHQAGEDDPISNIGNLKYETAQEYLSDNVPDSEVKSIDATKGEYIQTQNGLSFYFRPNIFELNGSLVTGQIDIEILEVLTPADMIFTGATTTSSSHVLESGGMFNLTASQGGQELSLTPGGSFQVNIPSNAPDFNMKIFQGVEDGNIVRWEERDSAFWRLDSAQKGYVLDVDFLKWCNLDKFRDEPNQTKVRVKLPDGYTNTNTKVFMVFKTNMVTHLYGDPTNEEFNTGSYTAPAGMDVKFVIISVKDKKLYYAIVPSKIEVDHLETVSTLTEITEDDLKILLQGL
jgi:hypothetical protein